MLFRSDLNQDPTPSPQPEAAQTDTNRSHHHPGRRLNMENKTEILHFLLNKASGCRFLPVGTVSEAATTFNVSLRSVSRIWQIARVQHAASQPIKISANYHNCGRKRIQINQAQVEALGMGERSCIRDLARNLGISKSACQRAIKRGEIRAHTNPLHPGLTEQHKHTRLEWIIKHLQGDTLEQKSTYLPMYDYVHLDEKWFYLSKKSHRVYLGQSEQGKYRATSSSKFIPKVMFTACVARPRFDSEGQCTFEGKIGVFPFTYTEPAKRASKNRPKGTIVTKLVERVNQKVCRSILINEILV